MNAKELRIFEEQVAIAGGFPFKAEEVDILSSNKFCFIAKVGDSRSTKLMKWGEIKKAESYLESEFMGNSILASTETVGIAEGNYFGNIGKFAIHSRQWIVEEERKSRFWRNLGHDLAMMHRCTEKKSGWYRSNFIGTIVQNNTFCDSWTKFFMEYRLKHLANDHRELFDTDVLKNLDLLHRRLDEMYPVQPNSILHGDLWHGNILCGNGQKPYLIDPSVYCGNREMDIAMTLLFGGFDGEFYMAYTEEYPLEKGWQERAKIWNLYPLLVHSISFGGQYLHQFKEQLKGLVRS